MAEEYITIRGARENNLKNVSLRIPKRKITVFTGVSGSGKSSIVFDTIAAEARRQLNETFSTFVRNFLPRYAQPDADAIENLSMAIVIDQGKLSVINRPDSVRSGYPEGIGMAKRVITSRILEAFSGDRRIQKSMSPVIRGSPK